MAANDPNTVGIPALKARRNSCLLPYILAPIALTIAFLACKATENATAVQSTSAGPERIDQKNPSDLKLLDNPELVAFMMGEADRGAVKREIREEIVRRGQAIAPLLAEALLSKGKPPHSVFPLVESLGKIRGRVAMDALLQWALETPPIEGAGHGLQLVAVYGISRDLTASERAKLLAIVNDRERIDADYAARLLAQTGTATHLPEVMGRFKKEMELQTQAPEKSHGDLALRVDKLLGLMRAMADFGSPAVEALRQELHQTDDNGKREWLALALARCGERDVLPTVLHVATTHSDASTRCAALDVYSRLEEIAAKDVLIDTWAGRYTPADWAVNPGRGRHDRSEKAAIQKCAIHLLRRLGVAQESYDPAHRRLLSTLKAKRAQHESDADSTPE